MLLKKKKIYSIQQIFRFATAFGLSDRMRYDLTINQFVLEMFVKKEIEIYDPQDLEALLSFKRLCETSI